MNMHLSDFFQLSPIPADAIYGTYDLKLVALSILVQLIASYVTIELGIRLRHSADSIWHQRLWLFGAAFAISAGDWAMHFIGMLGYNMHMTAGVEIIYIIYSYLIGLFISFFALMVIKNTHLSSFKITLGGIIFGLGIIATHYTSMEAMRVSMYIHYLPFLFFLSVISALFAAEATIWTVVAIKPGQGILKNITKLSSAIVITAGMCGLHYIAMASAVLEPKNMSDITILTTTITDPNLLAGIAAIVTILIMGIALVLSTYEQLMNSALNKKNIALEEALNNLTKLQKQLIQSEKMASLGQLIAGISHEINTPAGAILAAIGLIKEDYTALLQESITLTNRLSASDSKMYLSLCNKLISRCLSSSQSTGDIRTVATQIEEHLAKNNIHNSKQLSRNLATINISNTDMNELIPLLTTSEGENIQQSLFKFGMSQIHIRDIKIAIERIVELVKALKLYSQANQGKLKIVDLREQIENTLIILNTKLKKGITVQKEFDDIPNIECYAEPLNQVWTNIINNAIESMPLGGTIIVRMKQSDAQHVLIEIEDNGSGIKPEVLPRIFEPYFTTKEAGTGLGLSIAKDIVLKNQGSIFVESQPTKTIFSIIIPIKLSSINSSTIANGPPS